MGVAIGVDSHKSSLTAAAVDELGRVVAIEQFDNDAAGHRSFAAWVDALGEDVRVGIECSATYGAALAQHLLEQALDVCEVPPNLSNREARRAARGKSDAGDAVAIARVVARDRSLPPASRATALNDLKLLSDHRDQLIHARTRLTNRIHKDLVVIAPGYEKRVRTLRGSKATGTVLALIRGNKCVRAQLIRERVQEVRTLDRRIAKVGADIEVKLKETGTTLPTRAGVGPVIAAKILGEVGDVTRIRSKEAFAALAGTAPLPASSGATVRHRLNRGGNRQLNYALHFMALVLYRSDPTTKAYIDRRRQEGKTFKEALRCLKRHLANSVYGHIVADAQRASNAA